VEEEEEEEEEEEGDFFDFLLFFFLAAREDMILCPWRVGGGQYLSTSQFSYFYGGTGGKGGEATSNCFWGTMPLNAFLFRTHQCR